MVPVGQLTDEQVAEARALIEFLKVEAGADKLPEPAATYIDVGVDLCIAAVRDVFKNEARKELPDDNSD